MKNQSSALGKKQMQFGKIRSKKQSAVDGHHQECSKTLKISMSTLTEELQKHYKGVENGSWHADIENRFEKISMSKTLNDEDDIEQFPVLYELAKETLLCDRNASRQKVTAGFANLKKVRRVYPTFCHGRLFSLVHIRFYSAAQESREFVQHRCASTCCHLNAHTLLAHTLARMSGAFPLILPPPGL